MRPIKAPLNLGQTGEEVKNLHEVLMAFISTNVFIPASATLVNELAEEYEKMLFGNATFKLLQNFCTRVGIEYPSGDNTQLGETVASALNQTLNQLQASTTVTFSGSVRDTSGKPVAQPYVVEVYEAQYKNTHNPANTGEPFGIVQTDADGSYTFRYTYQPVAAGDANKGYFIKVKLPGKEVVFTSQTVYQNSLDTIRIDATVNDGSITELPEYESVSIAVKKVIGDNHIGDINLNNAEELEYLANATGEDVQTITMLVQAKKLQIKLSNNNQPDITPRLYALLRQNTAPVLSVLISMPAVTIVSLLTTSINNKTIAPIPPDELHDFAEKLASLAVTAFATDIDEQDLQESAPYRIAGNALKNPAKAQDFIRISAAYQTAPVAGTDIWEYIAEQTQPGTNDKMFTAADISNLTAATTLANLTGSNPALTNHLFNLYNPDRTIANWATSLSKEELQDTIRTLADAPAFRYPDFIDTTVQPQAAYAAYIFDAIQKSYPTQAIRKNIADNPDSWAAASTKNLAQNYSAFLNANPGFDIRTTPANELLQNDTVNFPGIEKKEEFTDQLGILQRLLNVTTNYTLAARLAADNLHSSIQISRLSQEDFINTYQLTSGSATSAKKVYEAAVSTTTFTYLTAIETFNTMNGQQIAVFQNTGASNNAYADWRTLFGAMDGCNCSHCQSVYSPAAYLTDLLQFLKTNMKEVYNTLISRRPDIVDIELSCKNINTPVPHIDIVNELLEDLISVTPAYTMYARQTKADAAIQRAIPEYVNTNGQQVKIWDAVNKKYQTVSVQSPYPYLKDAVYPDTLPYNYYKRQIDTHLELAGVKGHELAQRFSGKDALEVWNDNDAGNAEFCAAYLGISQKELDIITGNVTNKLYEIYGFKKNIPLSPGGVYADILYPVKDPAVRNASYPSGANIREGEWITIAGSRIDILLQQTGLTYNELQEVVDCYVINPFTAPDVRKMVIDINSSTTDRATCNPAQLQLTGLDETVMQQLYRFIRLKRALGWSFYDLDKAMLGMGMTAGSNIDRKLFIKMVQIQHLTTIMKLPVAEVALFWKDIDTKPYRDFNTDEPKDIPSEYKQIFRNSLTKDIELTSYPFTEAGSGVTLTAANADKFLNYLAGVFHINGSALDLIFRNMNLLVPAAGVIYTLHDLSRIRKEVMMMQALKLKAVEWLQYRNWMTAAATFGSGTGIYDQQIALFDKPFEMIRFVAFADTIRNSGAKIEDAGYLLRDAYPDSIAEEKDNAAVTQTLTTLRSELKKIVLPAYDAQADSDGAELVILLNRFLTAENASTLINIVQHPAAYPADHTAGEQQFIEKETAFFMNETDRKRLSTTNNTGYLTNTEARRILVFNALNVYILCPFIISFFTKEYKIQEDITKSLLNDCIEINNAYGAINAFLKTAFINGDEIIRKFTGTGSTLVKTEVFTIAILLKKAAWLINKFKLSRTDVTAFWGRKQLIPGLFPLSDKMVDTTNVPIIPDQSITTIPFSKWLHFLRWIEVVTFLGDNTGKLYDTINGRTTSNVAETVTGTAAAFKMSKEDLGTLLVNNGRSPASGSLNAAFGIAYSYPQLYLRIIDCLEMQHLLPATMLILDKVAGAVKTPDSQNEANEVIQIVKAQYDDKQWLEIIRPVNDLLRTERRDAMVAYLLSNPPNEYAQKWYTSNDIYETLMLDVDMMSCMTTTRVLLAVNTVQLWVDRVLLGLERNTGNQLLQLSKTNARQWQMWRKLYRVWEANRKIFVYPENWIEPELRDGKSPFFTELEKFLKQNDLTDSNVEDAYRTYLERLDEVAHLDIVAMYRETKQTDYKNFTYAPNVLDRDTIHVFGRTPEHPHIYYYRKRVADEWTPWEKMDVQIDGDHFVPVVWRGRLRFYWLVFTKDQAENTATGLRSDDKFTTPAGVRWKIQLAWSEYKNNRWSVKQLSKDAVYSRYATIETPVSREHIQYYSSEKWNENRSWNYNGDLEKIRDEYINFFCEFDADHNLNFKITEREYSAPRDGINHIAGATYSDSFPATNIDLAKVNEMIQSNDAYMGSNTYIPGTFIIKFNGVKVANTDSSLTKSLYADYYADPASIALYSNDYKIAATNYWYYKEPEAGYLHLPDGNKQLLGFAPGHTKATERIVGVSGRYMFPKINIFERIIIKDRQKSKFLVFPRQVPDNYVEKAKIAIPYFFYKDYENSFFVEKMEYTVVRKVGNKTLYTEPAESRYRFHNFRHLNVNRFQEELFKNGIDGLMKRSTITDIANSADTIDFKNKYKPTANVAETTQYGLTNLYPNSKVDFSDDGAYTLYNWELFFHIPLLIANKLSQDQKFEEARKWYHYVFNPTAGEVTTKADFWNFTPFFNNADNTPSIEDIMKDVSLEKAVARWAENPFKPHLVARTRISAYMKNAVMKYMDNLIAWGDMLFRTDTRENINEATLMYVLAAQLMGRKPLKIASRATAAIHTYTSLDATAIGGLNAFSNGLVKLESLMLPSGAKWVATTTNAANVNNAITGSMYYFCIPMNDKLAGYWDTIADRLFKIRHCQNIDGIERDLALYDPPIDPALLVKAAAAGISLTDALADMNAPLPNYRFQVMSQKATELAQEVKGLGGQLLSALEKKDAEKLALLRSSQELTIMDMVSEVREQQVNDTVTQINGLQQQQKNTLQRRDYYKRLVDGGLNAEEQMQLSSTMESLDLQKAQAITNTLSSAIHNVPNIIIGVLSGGAQHGGDNLGAALEEAAKALGALSGVNSSAAQMASTKAGFTRRMADWEQQLKTAELELKQLDQQILGAQIRQAISEMELRNHKAQLDNARRMDEAMRNKYTNEELYEWMVSGISITYFQAYKLTMDVAKRAERCYRYELGIETSTFIQPAYWDSLKKGLLAGEQLMYDIKRMEVSFLEKNKRHLELTKHISLANIFPEALISLRTGKDKFCTIDIPEWLFDMDYPGQHLRRIKSVSVSIPCVAGPYTTVSCKLSLLKSQYRKSGIIVNSYLHEDNFKQLFGNIQSIATSHAQSDSGMFEFSFRDERYLPFEGAGAISTWKIELPAAYAQFDYESIADVILHINYTALDEGGLKTAATDNVTSILTGNAETEGFFRTFSLRKEFGTAWNAYSNDFVKNSNATLTMKLNESMFPYYCAGKSIAMQDNADHNITVFLQPKDAVPSTDISKYKLVLIDVNNNVVTFGQDHGWTKISNGLQQWYKTTGTIPDLKIQRNTRILKYALLKDGVPVDMAEKMEDVLLMFHCKLEKSGGDIVVMPVEQEKDDMDWIVVDITNPGQPKLTAPSLSANTGATSVQLNWNQVPNATSYIVEQSATSTFSSPAVIYSGTGLTTTVNLSNSSQYFRIRATAIGFTSSNNSTVVQVNPALATPVITATSGDGSITLSWTAVPHATRYLVVQSTSSAFDANLITIFDGSLLTKTVSVTNGTTYYYKITAMATGYPTSAPAVATATAHQSGGGNVLPVDHILAWWKADALNNVTSNGYLDTWTDQSGNGNNISAVDPTKKPAIVSNWKNGKPALAFNGGQGLMMSQLKLPVMTPDITVFLVGEKMGTGLGCIFELSKDYNDNYGFTFFTNDGGLDAANLKTATGYNVHGVPNNLTPGVKSIYEIGFLMSEDEPEIETSVTFLGHKYQEAAGSLTQTDHKNESFQTDDFYIGARGGSRFYAEFNLAEMIILHSSPTPQERAAINTYLSEKYDFAPIPQDALKAWWKADKGVVLSNGKVMEWQDQSGNGYHRSAPDSLHAPDYNLTAFNNRPSVKSKQESLLSGLQLSLLDAHSIYIVARPASTDSGFILGNSTSDDYLIMIDGDHMRYASDGVAAFNIPTLHGINIVYTIGYLLDINSCDAILNGDTVSFTNGYECTFKTDQLFQGMSNGSNGFNGDIFEIIIYDRKVSPAEDTNIKNYLQHKYAHYTNVSPALLNSVDVIVDDAPDTGLNDL